MSELGDKERRFVEDQRRVAEWGDVDPYLRSALSEIERKDALLAEAAEVLRGMKRVLEGDVAHFGSTHNVRFYTTAAMRELWEVRAKPLLDKLEEK